jgi:hypothetical protein
MGRLSGYTPGDATEVLVDFLAERIAAIVAERFMESGSGLSAPREVMNAREAADFLRVSYPVFRRGAPSLPRHRITERRFVYLRSELLESLMGC